METLAQISESKADHKSAKKAAAGAKKRPEPPKKPKPSTLSWNSESDDSADSDDEEEVPQYMALYVKVAKDFGGSVRSWARGVTQLKPRDYNELKRWAKTADLLVEDGATGDERAFIHVMKCLAVMQRVAENGGSWFATEEIMGGSDVRFVPEDYERKAIKQASTALSGQERFKKKSSQWKAFAKEGHGHDAHAQTQGGHGHGHGAGAGKSSGGH